MIQVSVNNIVCFFFIRNSEMYLSQSVFSQRQEKEVRVDEAFLKYEHDLVGVPSSSNRQISRHRPSYEAVLRLDDT